MVGTSACVKLSGRARRKLWPPTTLGLGGLATPGCKIESQGFRRRASEHQSVLNLPTHLPTTHRPISHLPVYLIIDLSSYLSFCLSILSVRPSDRPSVHPSIHPSIHSISLSLCLHACLPAWLAGWLSVCMAGWLSVYLSVRPSVRLSVCLARCLPVYMYMVVDLKLLVA